ncbi:MBL fold metallo-hydrolase [Thalassoroseus pseudoceratinae]|uniref:MBL fold metallo-hydrolase n=1 Tax=Thalassoroseus pseudoceratinae TaxID=2713176 RepID=UPI00141DFC07|nr:MBL fold metallo-hydrolase [Thalassoroseus pseudoceratinae]
MQFHQRFVPGLAIASYIVGDEKSGEAAVIDPTRDVEDFIAFAKNNDLHIKHIIETHVHADFVCGSRELKARLNDEPTIHCSGYGGDNWTQPFADEYVKEGDTIKMGDVKFGFQHVPGHTPEHIAVTLFDTSRSSDTPWVMFSGDFLFVGDVGRPDLLGEEEKTELAHQLYESVFKRLDEIPDITEVYPAHGAGSLCGKAIGSRRSSTVGFERRYNTALKEKPEDQWVEDLLNEMPLSPPYFKQMKRVNKEGPAIIGPELPGQKRWGAKQVHERVCDNCLIVDVRSKESFAAAHIPNAINIPVGNNLPTWAGWVLPYDRPILLIAEEPSQIDSVVTNLLRVGFDDVQGYLEGGMGSWETAGFPLSTLNTMSVHDLDKKRKSEKQLTVLDVRTDKEWSDGHIDGALHIHGGTLQDRVEEISKDKPVAVVCGSGYRASIASSFLQREGFEDVTNVIGGMSAWKAAGLPTTK